MAAGDTEVCLTLHNPHSLTVEGPQVRIRPVGVDLVEAMTGFARIRRVAGMPRERIS
ncbi:hypothetical protein [Nocardia sp. AB354]|uniref:hypothetical protein n=1 Tax=Nocardia sp. AB354 TaxID=3413283 RepID=UPI003C14AA94